MHFHRESLAVGDRSYSFTIPSLTKSGQLQRKFDKLW